MSNTLIQPYLFFGGNCEQAVEFYRAALGATVDMMLRFKDSPEQMPEGSVPPGAENNIMHCSFRVGESVIMASDGCGADSKFAGFSLSLTLPNADAARKAFDALAAGGTVTMPLAQTFWSPCFGMVTDRFGVGWMVTVCA